MQTASSRIWIRVAESISYNGNITPRYVYVQSISLKLTLNGQVNK